MRLKQGYAARACGVVLSLVVLLLMAACGGGSKSVDSSKPAPPDDRANVRGLVCNGPGETGWCWQSPLPQGNGVSDRVFIDDTHGWVVGAGGMLLATDDAGRHWRRLATGTQALLSKVVATSRETLWIASHTGDVLRSLDAGASWQVLRSSERSTDTVVNFGASDAQTAWLSLSAGPRLVTSDGGRTWRELRAEGSWMGHVQAMPNAREIWGGFYGVSNAAQISRSVDGGLSWTHVALPVAPEGSRYNWTDVQAADGMNALVIGSDLSAASSISADMIWRTRDGGATWRRFTPASAVQVFTWEYRFIDADTVGFLSILNHRMEVSSDDGQTWQRWALPVLGSNDGYVSWLKVLTPKRLLVGGHWGPMYLTHDAGLTWTRCDASAEGVGLNDIWFFDAREGLAIGGVNRALRTTDGGQTWAVTSTGEISTNGWTRIEFTPSGHVGWGLAGNGLIYRTTDRGRTWVEPRLAGVSLYIVADFHFIDELRGWAVRPNSGVVGGVNNFFRTVDGGRSWQPIEGTARWEGYSSIRFFDETHGVAVGRLGDVLVTDDGGMTWAPRPTGGAGGFSRVVVADRHTAVAVGLRGVIFRTTDRGQTWVRSVNPPLPGALINARFFSSTLGHAVGENGVILTTDDAGATWTALNSGGVRSIKAVHFTSARTGWVAGDNGTILTTVTGGR